MTRGGERQAAEEVLRALIDARLLTGYRDAARWTTGRLRRVEIIHESLLTSWPRLVRWQTQDADSARLRDELRQAARLWDDHERSTDYLWTGKAFREFSVWRENYPGGLTDLEEAFASAMTSLATRRRRRRRIAAAAVFVMLLAVLAVVGTLWRRSVQETRRAEAAKLLALGQLRLEDYPTATLAHAIASLELADTPEARRLALRALWEGPTAFVINDDQTFRVMVAGRGGWIIQSVQRRHDEGHIRVVTRSGSSTTLPRVHDSPLVFYNLNRDGSVMFSVPVVEAGARQNLVLWSLPDGRRLNETWIEPPAGLMWTAFGWNPNRLLMPVSDGKETSIQAFGIDGSSEFLGSIDLEIGGLAMDRNTGRWFATLSGERVLVFEIGEHNLSKPRDLGRHEGSDRRIAFDPEGGLLVTSSSDGRIKIWDAGRSGAAPGDRGSPGHRPSGGLECRVSPRGVRGRRR